MSVLSMSGESEIPHKSLINIEESDEDIPASKKFKSVYTVSLSDKFQTLDFSVKQSKLSNYFQGGQSSLVGFYVLRWAMVVLTGVMVGVIHFIMHAGVTVGSSLKVQWLEVITDGFPQDVWRTYLGLAGFNMIFLGTACALCLFFGMEASGGNVSGVMAYLNGSRIKKFFTIRTVLVKMCSTTAMMCTATPGGMEGPIIHIGAAVGNIAPIVIAKLPLPTKFRTAPSLAYLNSVSERRDLSVCGVAAGVSAGFGAPFGGIFLALEETTTFFSAEMLPRLVVGSFLAKFISDILEQSFVESELEPGEMFYKLVPHLRLAEVLTPEDVGLFEFAIVLLYGLTGLIVLNRKVQILRRRLALGERKLYLFCEVLCNAAITSTFLVTMLLLFSGTCSSDIHGSDLPPMSCPEGSIPIIGMFMITFDGGYRTVVELKPDAFPMHMLIILFIFYFVFTVFCITHCYSSGFFMVQFMLGSLWGRILGEGLHGYLGQDWADPRKFALVGAASQITGMARSQVCIVCLLLEGGNVFESCGAQVFLATIVTKVVAELCIPSIYHVQLDLMGVPYVEASAPTGSRADVKHLLRQEMEIFQSDLVPRVAHLYDIVQEQKGNYPIVTPDKKVIGDISRCLLYKLMASQVFDAPQPFPEDGYSSLYKIIFTKDCSIEYLQQVRQDMLLNVSEDDKDKLLDLSPFMNKNLFFVRRKTSLYHIYHFFRRMGMRTLYIVDRRETLHGVITRKDVARYKIHLHMGHVSMQKVKVPNTPRPRPDIPNPSKVIPEPSTSTVEGTDVKSSEEDEDEDEKKDNANDANL
ncbi:hypothetical protein M8J75_002924 [Diaphorina citri]|nr:hypothetical protein M8J75_002924 [Diaphorina citri]